MRWRRRPVKGLKRGLHLLSPCMVTASVRSILRYRCTDGCYDRVAPLFSVVPRSGSLRHDIHVLLNPKTDLMKNETATPDEKSHGLGTKRESRKKSGNFPTTFGQGAVDQKSFKTKGATSTVARVPPVFFSLRFPFEELYTPQKK